MPTSGRAWITKTVRKSSTDEVTLDDGYICPIEGPSDMAKAWFESFWTRIQCHASRLQTRIVKVLNHRVLHGALSRLEPCAGKLARPVLRGLGGGNVTRLPDTARSGFLVVSDKTVFAEQVGLSFA